MPFKNFQNPPVIDELILNFLQAKSPVATIQVKNGLKMVSNLSDPVLNGKTLIIKWNGTANVTYYQMYKSVKKSGSVTYSSGSNILGLVVFSLAVGLVAGKMGKRAQVFIDFVSILNDIVMTLVGYVMWYVSNDDSCFMLPTSNGRFSKTTNLHLSISDVHSPLDLTTPRASYAKISTWKLHCKMNYSPRYVANHRSKGLSRLSIQLSID